MKRSVLALIVLALAATVAPGDQWVGVDVDEVIANAPSADVYPDDDAVYLKMQESTDVAADGSTVTLRNKLIRILTLRGRETYSNQSEYYNTHLESLTLTRGFTVTKMGRTVEVEEDGVNDITPAFLEGATMYANVLQKVVSFPVAGPGSTTDLELREERIPEKDGSYAGIEYLGANDPVLAAEFTLRYPPDGPAPVHASSPGLLDQVMVDVTEGDGEIAWMVKDVPSVVEEENRPPWSEIQPRLLYSSYETWDDVAAFVAGEFYPHVETGGEVAAKTTEVARGATTDAEKTGRIFTEVATNVRNVFLDLGLGGYEPNDASTVLSNKYGDYRDKAVLLVSMLRAAGIDAYPAAFSSVRGTFVESVPTLKQFNRLMVAVRDEAGYTFLDPFLDDAAYGYVRWGRGNPALVVKDDGSGELVTIPPFKPSENDARKSLSVFLQPDGSATVRAVCHLFGYFDRKSRMELKDATPSERDKIFEQAANAVATGATSTDYYVPDLANLLAAAQFTQSIDAPDFAVRQGDMMIVRIPGFPFDFANLGVYPSLAKRTYPFDLPVEATSEYDVKVVLPEGYQVAYWPEPINFNDDLMSVEFFCDWYEGKQSILWRMNVTLKAQRIPVDRYAEFKELFDRISSPKNSLILLKKGVEPGESLERARP
jgi:transglutaminase-like putative cysteine protease